MIRISHMCRQSHVYLLLILLHDDVCLTLTVALVCCNKTIKMMSHLVGLVRSLHYHYITLGPIRYYNHEYGAF